MAECWAVQQAEVVDSSCSDSHSSVLLLLPMQNFIPGLKLSELFYAEAAKPILDTFFPKVSYSAALLGWGSEVLGYDDIQSSDHHWGPRFLLFVSAEDHHRDP